MARTPRASVSMTSGQGISRGSYQKARSLTKNENTPQVKRASAAPPVTGTKQISTKMGAPLGGNMNVSYGDTFDPTDLADITADNPKKAPKNPPRGLNIGGGGGQGFGTKGKVIPK